VAYPTSRQHAGGCVGAMSYYTASGEPPGQWAGKGAAALGLSGQVVADGRGARCRGLAGTPCHLHPDRGRRTAVCRCLVWVDAV
jgi:hypothetical protein